MKRAPAVAWTLVAAAIAFPYLLHFFAPQESGSPIERAEPTELLALRDLGGVPAFTLTERNGNSFGATDLQGRPWLASFLFTTCEGPCPVTAAQLAQLQRKLQGTTARIVTFTVDPETDTPAVLADYANDLGADRELWLFLTGERAALHALVRDGFHLGVDEDADGLITHSTRAVLVDAALRIRRYYTTDDAGWEDLALADLERLGSAGANPN